MTKPGWTPIAALALAGVALAGAEGHSQGAPGGEPSTPPARTATAVRAADPVRIDGRLDEESWTAAPLVDGFVQRQPNPGAPATRRTEVRVLYREDAVYVGARLLDHPDSIAAQLARRDATGTYSDWFSVMLDSDQDRRSAFVFAVNPREVSQDYILAEDGREDRSWDAVWAVATRMDSVGWTAEFRIPLSQLRFSPAQRSWGVNFRREIARRDEIAYWAPLPPDASGLVSRFGDLTGVAGLRTPRHLELQPYTMGRVTREPGDPRDPFYSSNQLSLSGGADLKYSLTSGMTLTATLNPDFGQVDADPAQVNLTAYETFFPERRPFFVEGSEIFRFDLGSGEQILYSRRIGRRPRGGIPRTAVFSDIPEATTILGAAKLSGKTASGWSIGVLEAVTSGERARLADTLGIRSEVPVEPLTNYGVIRVLKDFRQGRSAVGAIFTATHRGLDDARLKFLPSAAYTGGVDARHRFGGGNYEASGWVLASRVDGDTSAIRILQTSSTHYFQRPDAPHLDFKPDRTSLEGIDARARVTKVGGGHWRGEVLGRVRTPGFDLNDLGFQRTADWVQESAYLGYTQYKPGKHLRSWQVYVNQFSGWTLGGERTTNGANANMGFQLPNLWSGYAAVTSLMSRYYVDALRGGPALRAPSTTNATVGFNSDPRSKLTSNAAAGFERDDAGGHALFGSAGLSYRPSAQMQLSLSPSVTFSDGAAQYISQVPAAGDGAHYLFGGLKQRTVSLTTRLNYTFTPNLSLQFYAQPFISAGDYSDFKEVTDPKAERFSERFHTYSAEELSFNERTRRYEVDRDGDGQPELGFRDPDFNFRQLRSNTVLRWEYRPGSTVFLVWSQGRRHSAAQGQFDLWSDTRELFAAPGSNVLLLKVSYWLVP